jgi:hypothetical protein
MGDNYLFINKLMLKEILILLRELLFTHQYLLWKWIFTLNFLSNHFVLDYWHGYIENMTSENSMTEQWLPVFFNYEKNKTFNDGIIYSFFEFSSK